LEIVSQSYPSDVLLNHAILFVFKVMYCRDIITDTLTHEVSDGADGRAIALPVLILPFGVELGL
jgi:hypothetical protein